MKKLIKYYIFCSEKTPINYFKKPLKQNLKNYLPEMPDKVINSIATILSDTVVETLNSIIADKYEFHHLDGNRNNDSIDNIAILPKNIHDTITYICKQHDNYMNIENKQAVLDRIAKYITDKSITIGDLLEVVSNNNKLFNDIDSDISNINSKDSIKFLKSNYKEILQDCMRKEIGNNSSKVEYTNLINEILDKVNAKEVN